MEFSTSNRKPVYDTREILNASQPLRLISSEPSSELWRVCGISATLSSYRRQMDAYRGGIRSGHVIKHNEIKKILFNSFKIQITTRVRLIQRTMV